MRTTTAILALVLLLLCGCGGRSAPTPPKPTPEVQHLRERAKEIRKREELDLERVKVRQLLVSYTNSSANVRNVKRTLREAEVRAAEFLKRVEDGEDFLQLVREESDDGMEDGQCILTREVPENTEPGVSQFYRKNMVPGFWNTAWRLEVGEIAPVEYHADDCPYGYHLIMRLE